MKILTTIYTDDNRKVQCTKDWKNDLSVNNYKSTGKARKPGQEKSDFQFEHNKQMSNPRSDVMYSWKRGDDIPVTVGVGTVAASFDRWQIEIHRIRRIPY